jgi:hypothetical protein
MSSNRRVIFELNKSSYATAPNSGDRPKVIIKQGGIGRVASDALNRMIDSIAKL